MLAITPYQSTAFGVTTAFGLPLTTPQTAVASGSSQQPTSRQRLKNPNGSVVTIRKQNLFLTITFVILP